MPETSRPHKARAPLWADATFHTTASTPERMFSINKPFFISPNPAGRKITAGFSWMQRIGKTASMDVWFPDMLKQELSALIARGGKIGPQNFPAEWAAVRQFELLQEAGNYKVYDLNAGYLSRTLVDLMRSMRAGGYRVTVATIGSYDTDAGDDLEILDKRLQDRLSRLTHMLYMEEESQNINSAMDRTLAEERWHYQSALPHVGLTIGARELFKSMGSATRQIRKMAIIPAAPHQIMIDDGGWISDFGVADHKTEQTFTRVAANPLRNQYAVHEGRYQFSALDCGRKIVITCVGEGSGTNQSESEKKHLLTQQFFNILSQLPQKHIVHDTVVGLQLPESINEHEWLYLAEGTETFGAFNQFLSDIFTPFNRMNLSRLHGRETAGSEVKPSAQHMRSYGDHMRESTSGFYRDAALSLYGMTPA